MVGERGMPRLLEFFARANAGDQPPREQLRGFVQGLGDHALAERVRALMHRLPPRDEPQPGPDPRRGR
jgi:hypothetical protein